MNLVEFIRKWTASTQTERAASQEHFLDLCHLLGKPTPNDADPHGDFYAFEKGVEKLGGGDGFADVWLNGNFCWEYKGKHKNLTVAFEQLCRYRDNLNNPPLLVVCDLDRFEVHTNFTGTAPRVYRFSLADLASTTPTTGSPLPPLEVLRRLFENPSSLRPEQTTAQVTELAAKEFATLAQRLASRGEDAEATAHFLMRLLFCLFAEDVRLLPEQLFKRLVENTKSKPADFTGQLAALFGAMAKGGWFGVDNIAHFNGGLFADNTVLALTREDMDTLLNACRLDWSSIEPAIFGTLFERSLDPSKRAELGAHYISREDIELIVEPVLMAPLRRRWAEVQDQARSIVAARDRATGGARSRQQQLLSAILTGFAEEIGSVRILDPACGSGNFLYVCLKLLHDLELEVITFAGSNGLSGFFPHVNPEQLNGIETNAYAYELAQVVIWIGHLQWMRDRGYGWDEPILKPLHAIQHMDAVLTLGGDGRTIEPTWPAADVIVGNPPFLGGNRIRQGLGDEYVSALFSLYDGRIPAFADLVCYWFEKARAAIASGTARRAGLLATQAIRGGVNRRVLERIRETGDIFWAQSDRNWILDGAMVHVSMIGFDDGSETSKYLDGKPVTSIHGNLTSEVNLTTARRLVENRNLCVYGSQQKGSFDIDVEQATLLLSTRNPFGKDTHDVVKQGLNGEQLMQGGKKTYVIDFGVEISMEEAALYEKPFEYLKRTVYEERKTRTEKRQRQYWWLHARPSPRYRNILARQQRYIATAAVAKHRVFVWLDQLVLANHQILVFAREDDYFLGVLQSTIHELWARALGTQVREADSGARYTPSTTFETFPFPWPPGKEPRGDRQLEAVADAARQLVDQRDRWLHPAGATEAELASHTLTNLYNQRPTWLANAHAKLDAAVFNAYGWPSDLSDDEILARLLALNLEREPA